jgi:hypothetical protein
MLRAALLPPASGHGFRQLELEAVELGVKPVTGKQPLVRADLHQTAGVEHGDAVSMLHRAEPMGDDDARATRHQSLQGFLHEPLVLAVKRRGGFVEQQDAGIPSKNLIPGEDKGCPIHSLAVYPHAAVLKWDGDIVVQP